MRKFLLAAALLLPAAARAQSYVFVWSEPGTFTSNPGVTAWLDAGEPVHVAAVTSLVASQAAQATLQADAIVAWSGHGTANTAIGWCWPAGNDVVRGTVFNYNGYDIEFTASVTSASYATDKAAFLAAFPTGTFGTP